VPTSRLRRRGIPGISLLLAALVGLGLYLAFRHVAPILQGSNCTAAGDGQEITLGTGQAGIAATIAGVAQRDALPARAVTVAYAAALQESKLQNLPYGDRDSVGVFQQRPSQGWGPASRLVDPVYASTRFFRALAQVHGYQRMPVYRAAQAVQHSADGYAYQQYQTLAAHLTTAFTGASPRAVWCWPAHAAGKAQLTPARRAMLEAFGPLPASQSPSAGDAPSLLVQASQPRLGWALAAWLVTHADRYRLHQVRYAGFQWPARAGRAGWSMGAAATPAGTVQAS